MLEVFDTFTSMNAAMQPVAINNRADILDVLRGFAILGIFIANSTGFSLYAFMTPESKEALATYSIDYWISQVMEVFIDGKFYSMFSFLFGVGFAIILERNKNNGSNPLIIFYRRLLILAFFGLGHLFLLWEGDILFLYAIIGFVLPLFRNLKSLHIIYTSVFLILSPVLVDSIKVLSNGVFNPGFALEQLAIKIDASTGITDDNYRTYLVDNTTYQSILNWCKGGFFWRYENIISSNRIPKVLAMFLIGSLAGKERIFFQLQNSKSLFRSVQKWGFAIGIPASIAMAYFSNDKIYLPNTAGLFDTLFYALGVIPMSLAYIATICLLWNNSKAQKLLMLAAPVGRMALTNYILQTVVGIFVYYGIGLSLGHKSGPSIYIPIAIVVYFAQLLFSSIWLKYFKFGPLEWIWRMLTYGKRIPLYNK